MRRAEPGDADAIAGIYNQGIEDRVATFETEPRSSESVADLLQDRDHRYPAVVAEDGGTVLGFAWTYPYSERPCYRGVAEFSVYVGREQRNRGIGARTLEELVVAAQAAGIWKLTSRLFAENTASRRLCARLGFREVGIHHRHAQLDGEWRDCVLVERSLEPAP
ncbi:MAG: arsinothricin resistance N-acetyltransferase ArsN1 family A [Candidatus Dormibacteria bacterium]